MSPKPLKLRILVWATTGILALMLAVFLQACTPGVETFEPAAVTAVPTMLSGPILASNTPMQQPTKPASQTPTPSPTLTATEPYIPTPFPTSLEAYGLVYDEKAALRLPPEGSISMLFWGRAIPVKPIESTPAFISHPAPERPPNAGDRLVQMGCQLDRYGYATCSQDSPLLRYGCDFLVDPGGIDYGLEPGIPLVAVCEKITEEWEAAKAEGVYLFGCALKREIHYIFKIGDQYVLVSRTDELKGLFAPVDSPDEALSYAQLVTGLKAIYSFSFDPTLMYFHETIEGTHVTQTGSVFEMNLFNFDSCGCEPHINSQIKIQVDRAGLITWKDAVPVFMTTGWSCAD